MTASPRKSILIVGAGPGGLTAAMILARRGFDVKVLERQDRVGGRNAGFSLGPYRFDLGPTFLMMRHILDEVFAAAGARTEEHLQVIDLDPMYRLQFRDFALHPSRDWEKVREEIRRVLPGHEAGLDRFRKTEKARFERMFPCLQKHYLNFGSLFCKEILRVIPHLSLGRSVFDVLHGYFGHEDLAVAFSFQSKYLGMSPWECPGYFAMLAYIEYAFGVQHVRGGLSEISVAMAEVARRNGAEIRLGTEVRSLKIERGEVRGVELADGRTLLADEVIVNADFAWAMSHLVAPENLRKYHPDRLKEMRYSCSTFMLYLGLDKCYDLPHHTIYFADRYRDNVEDIFSHRRVSEDTSLYVRNASVTDPTLAPPGHSAVYILVPVANAFAGIDWAKETGPLRNRVLATWARRAGLDLQELTGHIRAERIIAPPEWERDHHVYASAVFNLAHCTSQMAYLRPHNRFQELGHCYLVGGGTHPGSGLPTIYESGRIAANLISEAYGVPCASGAANG